MKTSVKGIFLLTASNNLVSLNTLFAGKDAEGISLRFALASDGHYGQPNTSFEELHESMVNQLNTAHSLHKFDFVVINGDIVHDDPVHYPAVKKAWDTLTMPYYVTHGNHDQIAEEQWRKIWGTPWHYHFTFGDTAFLVLNSADDKGTYICPNLAWTEDALTRLSGYKNLFVFMHITPIKWTGSALPCPELVSYFEKANNLRAIFHGHDHEEDYVKEQNGVSYFFDSHIAGNWGTDYHGYRIVELMNNGNVLTYQVNPGSGNEVNQTNLTLNGHHKPNLNNSK